MFDLNMCVHVIKCGCFDLKTQLKYVSMLRTSDLLLQKTKKTNANRQLKLVLENGKRALTFFRNKYLYFSVSTLDISKIDKKKAHKQAITISIPFRRKRS